MIDGKTCTCEPVGISLSIRDNDCPLNDDQHRRQAERERVTADAPADNTSNEVGKCSS